MREYHRAIFFTKAPLGGYYKYKDYFQIFPCDLENRPVTEAQRHFPNILEFWTSKDEKIKSPIEFEGLEELFDLTARTLTKQDNILALLTAFTNNIFFRYTDLGGNWGIPLLKDNPGKEANTWSSKWCYNMYHFPDLPRQMKITQFSEQKIKSIKRVNHQLFYTYKPNLDSDIESDILFPETIDLLFDSYYSIEQEAASYIDVACSYIVSAIELHYSKKTLSLLSSFTAMETMVNLEYKDDKPEQCDTCGQLKFSVSRKFREYLLKYIGDSQGNKKKFNNYYSIRSKIVHTGKQLKTEKLFADVPEDEKQTELVTRIEILQISKMAIANWLLTNKVRN
ncbi:MAG: hypothetical protein JJ971_10520 [Balneolaceae bacterium]|nr:hypothetical protein [Balneolaceae bacterium]MBO6546321.1 hypothetical protein [Balneolaceae bacterium]MBO6648680.1 hypothetical protein [Balneolaceae bacterium]